MKGFFGRWLLVDLDSRTCRARQTPEEWMRKYLGGKGLATRILRELNRPGADPLGPENHLIVATGPVTTSNVQGSCRYVVVSRSPLTGFYAESYSGGKMPEAVSRTGWDAIALCGAASSPVALVVDEKGAKVVDAQDLWGLDTYETEEKALKRWGSHGKGPKRSGAMVIGPAGENLVRCALIENDKWRSAGRTGMGAVLGAKKVKALVFNGAAGREPAHPADLADWTRQFARSMKGNPAAANYRKWGTPMMVDVLNEAGAFPSRYWAKGRVAHQEDINATAMHRDLKVKPSACLRCIMACGKHCTVEDGRHKGLMMEGPEYETIYAFGGLCEITDIREIVHLNDLCDRLGIDTITGGNLCAFAMEASYRGAVSEKIEYGNAGHAAEILRLVAHRKGVGDILARGIAFAAAEWGLSDLAVHVKGMEPAGYDPRALKGMGLAYAVSDRGACHLRSTFYKAELSGMIPPDQVEGKAEMFLDFEDRLTLFDCLILCRFYRDNYPWDALSEIIGMTTGLTLDQKGLAQVAADVSDQVRLFNLAEGLTVEDDSLPKRLHDEPLEDGRVISQEELRALRADYYRLRGWDEKGRPRAKA